MEAIEKAGYRPGRDVALGLDCASSEFYSDGDYTLACEGQSLKSAEFTDLLASWVDKYPIISIEDGMAENDWDGWKLLTQRLGDRVQLVGDDVFVTNTKIIEKGISGRRRQFGADQGQPDRHADRNAGGDRNGQARAATPRWCRIARAKPKTRRSPISRWRPMPLQIKTGSLSRSDRLAKYNQLLRIEEDLGDAAAYAGRSAFYQIARGVIMRACMKLI